MAQELPRMKVIKGGLVVKIGEGKEEGVLK